MQFYCWLSYYCVICLNIKHKHSSDSRTSRKLFIPGYHEYYDIISWATSTFRGDGENRGQADA